MAGPVLDVSHLTIVIAVRGRRLIAVDDVSFQIDPGEVLGLVGESGAGKSLTGAAIIDLLPPLARIAGGTILLNGERIDNLPPKRMRYVRGRRIGVVFQDPLAALNPLETIGRQLIDTITAHLDLNTGQARARAVKLLEAVGLSEAESRLRLYPHQLSGGMRQRVMIALAVAAGPRLVIADEPTSALDVSLQAQVIELLKQMCGKAGAAVLLISHDLGVVAQAAHRIAVMYSGRIVEIGAAMDVVHRPQHPYTAGLMASIPRLGRRGARLTQISGAMPPLGAVPPGCPFHPRCAFRFGRCSAERPELMPTASGRAACWLHDRAVAPAHV